MPRSRVDHIDPHLPTSSLCSEGKYPVEERFDGRQSQKHRVPAGQTKTLQIDGFEKTERISPFF